MAKRTVGVGNSPVRSNNISRPIPGDVLPLSGPEEASAGEQSEVKDQSLTPKSDNPGDTDSEPLSPHHTLGYNNHQAAPGRQTFKYLLGLQKYIDTVVDAIYTEITEVYEYVQEEVVSWAQENFEFLNERITAVNDFVTRVDQGYSRILGWNLKVANRGVVGMRQDTFSTTANSHLVGLGPTQYWLYCNGALLSRAAYPKLFSIIGTTYNTGGEASDVYRLPTIFLEDNNTCTALIRYRDWNGTT